MKKKKINSIFLKLSESPRIKILLYKLIFFSIFSRCRPPLLLARSSSLHCSKALKAYRSALRQSRVFRLSSKITQTKYLLNSNVLERHEKKGDRFVNFITDRISQIMILIKNRFWRKRLQNHKDLRQLITVSRHRSAARKYFLYIRTSTHPSQSYKFPSQTLYSVHISPSLLSSLLSSYKS